MRAAAEAYVFPLSAAQERIWLADERRPGNPAYNASFRWSLQGPLNIRILERSFNEIVRRHEILRATFARVNENPAQIIAPALQLRISVMDLRSFPIHEREREIDRLCGEEATRSFDLKKGPLIRVGLLRTHDQQHVLMLTLHHIVCDGWSISLIMEELQKIYGAFASGQPSPLPELPIQYGDYVVWQREHNTDAASAPQLAYWRRQLAGYRRLEVKTDFPRTAEYAIHGAIVSEILPRDLTDALKKFSDQQGGTLFITALAACMVLLHRYTGETDIAVGSPLAGRNQMEVEGLIGLFVNHVIFRVVMPSDPTFFALEKLVRNTVLETFANQDVPFERIVAAQGGVNGRKDELFYSINFICQREYARASTFVFEFAGLQMTTMPSKSQGALYDLNFFMVERAGGWRLSIEYNSDLYRETTARKMLEDFRGLLEGIAAEPAKRISELVLSSEVTRVARMKDTVDAAHPTASLATDRSSSLNANSSKADQTYMLPASYAQMRFWLLARADPGNSAYHMPACVRLSGRLSETILKQSLQALTDRHEILRTSFVECNGELVQVIRTIQNASFSVSVLEDRSGVDRDRQLHDLLREEARRPFDLANGPLCRTHLVRLTENDHVLIVTLHHIIADGWSQNIFQRELWSLYEAAVSNRQPSIAPLDIQFGDFAVWQKKWLASDEAREDIAFWKKQLSGPLPILKLLTNRRPLEIKSTSPGAIETLLLPRELVLSARQLSQFENVTFFMALLACFAVLLHCRTDQTDILIGSPAANRRADTEPLIGPFAAPIALRLDLSGNPSLREILRRARDTTTDALAHSEIPFSILLDELKVRSVRGRNPLFQFYFLYQTAFLQPRKLGGLTVMPLPTFGTGTPFELQLAVIERDEGVRAQLEYNSDLFDAKSAQEILRNYQAMLEKLVSDPNRRIADLEKTQNGAVVARLPATDRAPIEYVAPRNSDELRLTQVWEEVFEKTPIGVLDNFFDLGGYSILAARLVAEVKKQFGVAIDLSTLMIAPTVAELVGRLRGETVNDYRHLVPLRTSGTKLPLFCIHGGGGHLMAYRDMVDDLPADQPIYGLRAATFDESKAVLTVTELAADYLHDIRQIQKHGPYQLCGMSFGGLVAYEMATKLVSEGEEVGVIALFDTGNPAHYRNLPLRKMIGFHITYLLDRATKYVRRLGRLEIREIYREGMKFLKDKVQTLGWMVLRKTGRFTRASLHKYVRYETLFGAIGRAYTPKRYSGRILLFRAEGRTPEYGDDLYLGWNDVVAQGNIDVRIVPGSHLSLMDNPNARVLAEQMSAYLAVAPNTIEEGETVSLVPMQGASR